MAEASLENKTLVKQHALEALNHLSAEDKQKILEYIRNLILLEKSKNDKASIT
jgi:hypothetical protein